VTAPAGGGAVTAVGVGAAGRRAHAHGWNRLACYRAAAAGARALPRPARLGLARALGRALSRVLPEERRRVGANLARVLPGAPGARLEDAVSETFANFGAYLADLLTVNRGDPAGLGRLVAEVTGQAHLDQARAAGRGVVLLTAHLGNWDLGGRLLVGRLGCPTHVVLSAEEDRALEDFLRPATPGLRFVARRHPTSTLGLVAALRRAEAVALQGDRPSGGRGDLPVPFFGEPAAFPLGPFLLARAAGAPVVPAFCVMRPDRRYRIGIEPAIWVAPGQEARALARAVGALERAVAAYPTQWFNFFDVWSPAGAP
jgi:KDO2-lipid IV(A) lauroyltransferase